MTDNDDSSTPRTQGPGRPRIGGRVAVRLGDLLSDIDEAAARRGITRPQYIREALQAQLARDAANADE